MEHKLFSELIVRLPIKPDFILAKMLDELQFPFRNIKPVKKDVNNLFLKIFTDFVAESSEANKDFKNIEVESGSSVSTALDFGFLTYELELKKAKKVCPDLLGPPKVEFDDSVLTDEFMFELDRLHILMSVVVGASMRKAMKEMSTMGLEPLQSKIIFDQIFEFWTKYYKNDFCYLSRTDLVSPIKLEEKELELGLVRFFFNAFLNSIVQTSNYEGQRLKAAEALIWDTRNYKWYAIFGFWFVNRLEEKGVTLADLVLSDKERFDQVLDLTLNHS